MIFYKSTVVTGYLFVWDARLFRGKQNSKNRFRIVLVPWLMIVVVLFEVFLVVETSGDDLG